MNKRKDSSELKSIWFTTDELALIRKHVSMEIGQDKAFEGMFDEYDNGDEYAEKIAKSIVKKIKDSV